MILVELLSILVQCTNFVDYLQETELIYDLRGQIEQLHREMFELRKSIQSCVDMQVKLQLSSQPEVHPGELGTEFSILLFLIHFKMSTALFNAFSFDNLQYKGWETSPLTGHSRNAVVAFAMKCKWTLFCTGLYPDLSFLNLNIYL